MLSLHQFLLVELCLSAALALWFVGRFPALGPARISTAVGLSVAGTALLHGAAYGAGAVAHLPGGVYLALFGCALPAFFAAFVAAAWLLRALAATAAGRGGGPGDPVSARAR